MDSPATAEQASSAVRYYESLRARGLFVPEQLENPELPEQQAQKKKRRAPGRVSQPSVVDPENAALAIAYVRRGGCLRQASKIFGIKYHTLYGRLRKQGIRLRGPKA